MSTEGNISKQVLVDLLTLNKVLESLQFLAATGVIHPDSVVKGCKKFVKDRPAIKEHFAKLGREY